MQMLTCIHVLFDDTATTKYAILDLILLDADTDVSTVFQKSFNFKIYESGRGSMKLLRSSYRYST
jgi:hypothetical protein